MASPFTATQRRAFESTGQTVGRLGKGGFIAFEVDGVVARFAGKGAKAPDASVRKRLGPVLTLSAVYLAHARRRLLRGKTATHPEPWQVQPRTGKKGYFVGKVYARAAGVQTGDAQHRATSSKAFHDQAHARPGIVTGGLIKSLQATTSGRDSAVLSAQGSSIGSSTYFARIAAGAKGNKGGKKAKIKARDFVRNQIKLNSVWKHLRMNMLQPSDREIEAMAASAGVGLGREAFEALQITTITNQKTVKSGKHKGEVRSFKTHEAKLKQGTDPQLYSALVARWLR